MGGEQASEDEPDARSPVRGTIGVVGAAVGVAWVVYLGTQGLHAGLLFDLLPPLALTYVGIGYARRHLLAGTA